MTLVRNKDQRLQDISGKLQTGPGTEATALRITMATDSTGTISVDDGGAALSIDIGGTVPQLDDTDKLAVSLYGSNAASGDTALSMGGGVEAGALLVTIASNSTGVLSVDDNAGSLTVDAAELTAIQTALEIMDDWDETNRAAVNLIEDQVAIAGGTGTDAANVPRISLATDIALPSGENVLGTVGGNTGYVELTMTLTAATYDANDVLADTQELTGILRTTGGTGIIHSITILDQDDQGAAMDVVFMRTNVSLGTEDAAVSISDANANEILGVVEVAAGDYVDLVNSQVATKTNLGIGCSGDALDDLFIGLITRGTPTHTASGITVKVTVIQD